jgi:hypothetical protein
MYNIKDDLTIIRSITVVHACLEVLTLSLAATHMICNEQLDPP